MKVTQNVLAFVAMLFGLVTLFAGTRVLLGTDPGYTVYQPLLIYNVSMGLAYVLAGIVAFRHVGRGMYIAAIIFSLNLIVLGAIFYLYLEGSAIAIDSLRAMTLRTTVWLVLFSGLGWLNYRHQR